MKIITRLFFGLFFFSMVLQAQQLVDGIAAVVGNEIILRSEIEQSIQSYAVQNQINLQQNQVLLNQLREQTMQNMIEQKLLLAKAEDDTLKADETQLEQRVEQRMKYLVEQVGSESKLESIFEKPIKDIRKDAAKMIKEQMLVEQVRSQKFQGMKISRREVENFYANYADSLPQQEETVTISHILMNVKPSEAALQKARERMLDIRRKIQDGADFTEMARQYSEDPGSKATGGDLGFTVRGDFVPEYEAAAFALNEAEVSDIVLSQFGYHLIQMIERRGEKIHTRHILIQVQPAPEDDQATIDKLHDLAEQIRNGAAFGPLAKEFSDDPNAAADEGMIGTFETQKLMIPEFRDVLAALQPGQISEPFKTDFGYHIVRLEARQSQHRLDLKQDWKQIEQFALNYRMEMKYREWIQELRNKVPIDIKPVPVF
jgi:peptidyl-prolyl cis-trans isomerase SurA